MFDLRAKLQKTREGFVSPLRKVFQRRHTLGADEQDTIEELLLGADIGVEACERIMNALRDQRAAVDVREFLRAEFLQLLAEPTADAPPTLPRAILVIGVNGVGKTTSIAKLAHYYRKRDRSVLLASGDTFRAAARDQLATWADRLSVDVIAHGEGGDPAAVAFDACSAVKARGVDYAIVDTAGRLHTRVNLMEELRKIKRACEKVLGEASVDTYLVLDATLGQNSLYQAREFTRMLSTDGIILTKLDSTAKGGIVLAVRETLGVPVRFIGVGEAVEDFAEFSPSAFVDALLT